MGKLVSVGYEITSNEKDADIYVVNTCAFLKAARDELMAELKRLAKYGKPVYAKFDRLGCFEYSREPGTPAYKISGQISAKTKRRGICGLSFASLSFFI